MTYFDDLYQKLFKKNDKQPQITHEVLKRSEKFLEAYQKWIGQPELKDYLDKYQKGYHFKLLKVQSSFDVHLFQSSMANGFALSYNEEIPKEYFQYLFEYLSNRVLGLKYKQANADVMISDKGDFIETKEKYYFKPVSDTQSDKVEQHYGNILIEYIIINDRPSYIKVMASVYSDQLYAPPLDHDELVEYLFSPAVSA
ncbi:MAG: hypothetical protein AAGC88_09165 [Bacteroidota bacterium]